MIKDLLKNVIRKTGFNITKYRDLTQDIRDLVSHESQPVFFDIGANLGQTALKFAKAFPKAQIHSFEPSPSTFSKLKSTTSHLQNVHPVQIAFGEQSGSLPFNENENSDMSSFLEIGSAGWGNVKEVTHVEVSTIDEYCKTHSIPKLHLLKSDTQGYDLAVLKGAKEMLSSQSIDLISMEVNFAPIYDGAPSLKDIMDWMDRYGYKMMSIYEIFFIKRIIGWTDVLFVSPSVQARMKSLA